MPRMLCTGDDPIFESGFDSGCVHRHRCVVLDPRVKGFSCHGCVLRIKELYCSCGATDGGPYTAAASDQIRSRSGDRCAGSSPGCLLGTGEFIE